MSSMKLLFSALLLMSCDAAEKDSGNNETTDENECEILEDVSCWDEESATQIDCPEGYTCSGLSAYWCYKGTCDNLPECLSGSTQIHTPSGAVAISKLKVGMTVWSKNEKGEGFAATIEKAEHVYAPTHHKVLDIVLADGRKLRVSPDHPDATGRALTTLGVGDALGGSTIAEKTLIPYTEDRTWDILPSGPTGTYIANGIWLGSTLKADDKPLSKRGLKTKAHRN